MSAEPAPRKSGPRRVPLTSARSIGWLSIVVVFLVALLRLAGGLLHLTLFTSVAPSWTEMKAVTMVCFLFSAGALTFIHLRPEGSRQSNGAMLLGGIVALVGLATVVDYLSQLAGSQASVVTQPSFLNLFLAAQTRMALITAVVFTLVGFTLVLLAMGSRKSAHVAHVLAFPAATASYVVPLSYLLGVQSMSAVLGTPMALNTGLAFCFLCLGVFCARTDTWLMRAFTGDDIGAYMARRLLPALMATPLVVGWLRLQGERTGLFSSEVGVALVASTYTVIFVLLVWLAARAGNRTDARRRMAERATRESDKRYRELVDGSPIGIYRTTPDGRTLAANPALLRMLGYESYDELARRNLESEGFEPSYPRSEFKAAMARDSQVTGLESAWRKRDGTVVYLRENARAIRDLHNQIVYYDGTVEDVTERRRAEEALRLSEQKFALSFANNPAAIALTRLEDGLFLDVNDTWVALTGYSREEALGHSARGMRIWPSAESASRFVEELKTTGAMRGREQEFLKKSGEVYTAELSAQVLTIQGEKVILTTLVDITARERAEEALRESESKFRIVADNTYDFEFWLDPDGRYIYASPSCERITGHKPEEFLADPELRFKIAHPEDRQLLMDHSRSAEREEPGALDHRIIHRDGSIRWIGHVCQPIFDSGGRFLGTRGSNRDITERKRAEDALRGSDSFNQSIIDSSRDCIKILDMDGRLTYMSPAGQRLLGIKDMTTYLNVPYEEFWRGSDRATVVDVIEKAKEGQSGSFRGFCPTADGVPKWWDVSISPVLGANGKPESLLAVSRDITDRRRDEARVARLARLYAVLSRVNETIVRTHDAERLYSEVCRIVSEEGGFPLTWVGLVDGKQVVPVACCGTACDYLKEVRVETEGELGNGPTGVSIREGRAVVNADFASSPATAPWRQAAQQHGFRASASFPLRQKGKVVGAFTLYSSQPGEFDDEQVQLFQSLSADVSYALDAIDQERLRAVAEAALREAKETLEVKVKERTADLTAEIDERKRAEERLTAASQYARSLIESSLDPLVTISAEGRITDVNEATIKATGATRVELVGTDFSEYFTEPEKARDGYRRVFAEGFVTDYPLTIRHRDGRLSDVLYNASVYKDRRGNIVGVFAAARDITDRKRAEQALQKAHDTLEAKVEERTAELKRSNEELEQFAYVASHDLQQPLRMVASYVALLAQRYKGQLDEKADKYIAYATNGAKHMQTLINDLLAFSRVGTRPITFGPVELERVVRQAKENLAAVISQSDAVVETGPLPVVSGDQTQLTQLFQNLLDNAIKFRGKEPPRMKITADYADCADSSGKKHDESDISSPSRSPSGAISATSAVHAGSSSGPESVESAKSADIRSAFRVISVADNGIGIATSHQERIFKLFQRLHTEEEYPGTGIGLAVCKKIVERHGGSIRVESEPGKGATFIFTLPGADAEPTSGRRP